MKMEKPKKRCSISLNLKQIQALGVGCILSATAAAKAVNYKILKERPQNKIKKEAKKKGAQLRSIRLEILKL